MADGELTLKLDDDTARRLKAAADAAGQAVEDYAQALITDRLDDRWSESVRRLEEYDRTGESLSVQEALDHFDTSLQDRLANPR
ncbi:hypothetical protein JKL49_14840 [Phenylobacterium sp. 20VBR1]|uniref:Uncharacterized protein n=1 Tax=Phenylobacterium glaciei TaxID=2803784 RepID=A0A941D2F9_9CAUL|nr:hypothetical protein [Phenylobacterium glaciei]MBR7620667.1 hypothetical protein [Phenylobacterium glaciei]QQZ49454.1 hypothetical protein JKL49_21065 [Phenylobacterium glaciei]